MRFLFIEVILPLIVLLFLRSLLRAVFSGFKTATTPQTRRPDAPVVPVGGELKKDPVCGTYVSTVGSPSKNVNGQPVYFCSKACKDKYRAA